MHCSFLLEIETKYKNHPCKTYKSFLGGTSTKGHVCLCAYHAVSVHSFIEGEYIRIYRKLCLASRPPLRKGGFTENRLASAVHARRPRFLYGTRFEIVCKGRGKEGIQVFHYQRLNPSCLIQINSHIRPLSRSKHISYR